MSKRFLRWIDAWIADNVVPGSGGDIEAYDVRAARLCGQLLAEAAGSGFGQAEMDEEAGKVAGLIEARLAAERAFDLSQFGAIPED